MLGAAYGLVPRNTPGSRGPARAVGPARLRREGRQRLEQQARELRQTTEHVGRRELREVLEGRVQEPAHGHGVGVGRRVEVLPHAVARAGLDRLEERDVGLSVGEQVDRLVVPLGVHAVPGVELDQVHLGVRGGAEQPEEVVEHLGHEVPRRPGVEPEAVALPRAGAATELVALLEHRDGVAVPCEQRGGREPADATADDDDATGGHRASRVVGTAFGLEARGGVTAVSRPVVRGPGRERRASGEHLRGEPGLDRVRDAHRLVTSRSAGVAAMRSLSSWNSACASPTALRASAGQQRHRQRSTVEVGLHVGDQAALRRLVERADVDAREVRAAEDLEVGVQVAEEVDLLERGAQGPRTVHEHGVVERRPSRAVHEGAQAHEPDDLGGAVDVAVEGLLVVSVCSRSMRIDAKNGFVSSGPNPVTRRRCGRRRARRGSPRSRVPSPARCPPRARRGRSGRGRGRARPRSRDRRRPRRRRGPGRRRSGCARGCPS